MPSENRPGDLNEFHAYRLQYPHSPSTAASCSPVFGEVKPLNTIPSPSLSLPSALAKPALLILFCLCVKTSQMFFFFCLLLSNLWDSKCCKRLQSLSKLWVLHSQFVWVQLYCAFLDPWQLFKKILAHCATCHIISFKGWWRCWHLRLDGAWIPNVLKHHELLDWKWSDLPGKQQQSF